MGNLPEIKNLVSCILYLVYVYLVFKPSLKNRKVLTSPVNDIFESDIFPRLNNDFSNWTWCILRFYVIVLIYIL